MAEANGLVALFYRHRHRDLPEFLFEVQRRLLTLGVRVNDPVPTPDPRAPDGGSALRKAA